MTISLVGYSDKLTVRPGDAIGFKVSARDGQPYQAQLVRLINADAVSENANYQELELDSDINGEYPGRTQPLFPGSCAVVESAPQEAACDEFTLLINCNPTTPGEREQVLIGRWDTIKGQGWCLYIDKDGCLSFRWSEAPDNSGCCRVDVPLKPHHWHRLCLCLDSSQQRLKLEYVTLATTPLEALEGTVQSTELAQAVSLPKMDCPLIMAGSFAGRNHSGDALVRDCFSGRLENPMMFSRWIDTQEMGSLYSGSRPRGTCPTLLADWDFSLKMDSDQIVDRSIYRNHGRLQNLPLRAVKGTQWDGSEMNWCHKPEQYGAIRFNEEDLYDCGWQDDFVLTIPDGLHSGIYAVRLRQGDDEDYLPFFVPAPKGKPTARLAFMVPTYTYLAYGNNAILNKLRTMLGASREESHEFMKTPGTPVYDDLISANPQFSGSIYDCHSDGSPVHFSSWLRPMLNMRPKTILWTFGADMLFIDWLESQGIEYDIITDDLLDREGADLLNQYSVVMTGNHPEYPTTYMMDSIQSYMEQGGRFMYMGGNGFYWRSASSPSYPGAIEVRRGRTGTLAWKSEVGEVHHQFSGEQGGLWREIGRAPQQLFGVGFVAQGYGPSYYRVMPGARSSRAGFILDGVEGEILGDFGIFGGAAGEELDQANPLHGTPPHAVVLGRSENHGPGMLYVLEEMSATHPLEFYQSSIYADIVFFETSNGGAVFTVGSMSWCGSLNHNGGDNNISRITEKVINRFIDEEPFTLPVS